MNFVRKSLGAHTSISPWSGARGLKRFPSLKNNNVQKWESRFTLGLMLPKTHIIFENT